MSEGYIFLHRKIRNNALFKKDRAAMGLFIDLLMDAAWKDTVQDWRGTPVNVKRGQVMKSVREMSDVYGLSVQNVRTLTNKLIKHKLIQSEIIANKAPALITLCKYEDYQVSQQSANDATNNVLTKTQHTHQPTKEEYNKTTTTSSARAFELEGLNGSTQKYVTLLAGWLQPFAPDEKTAHAIIASNIDLYGSDKVVAGMTELQTQIAGGNKPTNLARAFSGFIKHANTDPTAKAGRPTAAASRALESATAISDFVNAKD